LPRSENGMPNWQIQAQSSKELSDKALLFHIRSWSRPSERRPNPHPWNLGFLTTRLASATSLGDHRPTFSACGRIVAWECGMPVIRHQISVIECTKVHATWPRFENGIVHLLTPGPCKLHFDSYWMRVTFKHRRQHDTLGDVGIKGLHPDFYILTAESIGTKLKQNLVTVCKQFWNTVPYVLAA
jgi:hypothetical protein